jgi:hypothetical protein
LFIILDLIVNQERPKEHNRKGNKKKKKQISIVLPANLEEEIK